MKTHESFSDLDNCTPYQCKISPFALLFVMNFIFLQPALHFPNKTVSTLLQLICQCVGVTLGHRFYLSVNIYLVN